jgi:hydrogenase/urease accessory protein HupE
MAPARGVRRAGWLALAAALAPAPARAHGSLAIGDFYGGLLQPVYHLESLLLLLALALFTGQLAPPQQGRVPAAFALAAFAGALLGVAGLPAPPAAWAVPAGALALGLAVAAHRAPPRALALALAALLGLAQGYAGSYPDRSELARPLLYALGMGVAPLLVSGAAIAIAERFRFFWMEVAFRVAGSWIATVALLVSALDLRGPR